jgi:NAD+ kinase
MAAAGGKIMPLDSEQLQFLIREHMIEKPSAGSLVDVSGTSFTNTEIINNAMFGTGEKLHVRWNSQRGRIFIDGSHLTHNLELGDEIMVDNQAPPLKMFTRASMQLKQDTAKKLEYAKSNNSQQQ